MLSDVHDIDNALEDFSDQFKSAGKRPVKLDKDYASTRQDLEKVIDELNQDWARTQLQILELRFKIKERMTR